MLIKKEKSCVVLVDLQPALAKQVIQPDALKTDCAWILEAAKMLDVPCFLTEQYPEKLGKTYPELSALIGKPAFPKVSFSMMQDKAIADHINETNCEQFILIGIETHICILQSALALLKANKEVFVVRDCVSSRSIDDCYIAFDRMRELGIQLVTREMVLFEWLETAGTDLFKAASNRFLK